MEPFGDRLGSDSDSSYYDSVDTFQNDVDDMLQEMYEHSDEMGELLDLQHSS